MAGNLNVYFIVVSIRRQELVTFVTRVKMLHKLMGLKTGKLS